MSDEGRGALDDFLKETRMNRPASRFIVLLLLTFWMLSAVSMAASTKKDIAEVATEACATVYEVTVETLRPPDRNLPVASPDTLRNGLEEADSLRHPSDQARGLREGLNKALAGVMLMMSGSVMPLKSLAGKYSERSFELRENTLYYSHDHYQRVHRMIRLNGNTFVVEGVPGFLLRFEGVEDGTPAGVAGIHDDGREDFSPRTM